MSSSAPRDAAAQPERTRLSWRRTVLTATVVGILAVRFALSKDVSASTVAAAALLALTWLAMLIGVQLRIRSLATVRPRPWRAPWPLLAGGGAIGFAGLGLVLTFSS